MLFTILHVVKASPVKKRRANGPVKKLAGTGLYLLTQTSYQQPSLQHQVSTDTKEDTEGVSGNRNKSAAASVVVWETKFYW